MYCSRWTQAASKPTSGFWTKSAGPILLQYFSSVYHGGCIIKLEH
jgi:hypothetical protein